MGAGSRARRGGPSRPGAPGRGRAPAPGRARSRAAGPPPPRVPLPEASSPPCSCPCAQRMKRSGEAIVSVAHRSRYALPYVHVRNQEASRMSPTSTSRPAGAVRRRGPGVHADHPHYKWWALSCTSLGMLMATINSGTLIIALPDLERALGVTLLQLVWVILVYMIAS